VPVWLSNIYSAFQPVLVVLLSSIQGLSALYVLSVSAISAFSKIYHLSNFKMSAHAPTTPRKSRDEQTLHDYLNDYSPEVPILADSVKPGPNTRNPNAYSFKDIASKVPTWRGFNYQTMRKRYNKILDRVVLAESAATSPQKGECSSQTLYLSAF
jgi:hypothetical protein